MNRLMVMVAAACLMTSGCANSKMLGCRDCGQQACHITRSQQAPRPDIVRTVCDTSGCSSCSSRKGLLGGRLGSRIGKRMRGGNDGCQNCGGRGCGLCARVSAAVNPHASGYPEQPAFNQGPPSGQVAYPYYTVRGPRDFLQSNPPTIGPR